MAKSPRQNEDEDRERRAFSAEAHRQSRLIAERSRDPSSDDYASLAELEALFEADDFASDWMPLNGPGD